MVSKTSTLQSQQKARSVNAGRKQEVPFKNVFVALIGLSLGIITPPVISTFHPDLGETLGSVVSSCRQFFISSTQSKIIPKTPVVTRNDRNKFVECNQENLDSFLHKEESNLGVHIFCFTDHNLVVYEDSHTVSTNRTMNVLPWSRVLNEIIYGELTVTPHTRSNTQPFAFFSTDGEKILDEVDFGENSLPLLMQHGMVLLFQGGNWIWPGVHIGFKRQVNVVSGYLSPHTDQASSLLEIETISMKPLVLSVKNFISEKECDHIQNIAEPDMEYSSVSLMDKDKGRPASDFRTSQSAFLVAQDEIMHALEDRTASLTRIPKNHQEYTQVLRYGYSEKYSAHLDWFDPELYQQDPQTQSLIDYGKRNRLATVFWYLSNVEKGGHTVFPRFNGAPQPYDFDDCTKGLKVKPEKGKVIIFYSMLPNGQGDPLSLHGACPVEKGIKWAANKWIWNAKMTFLE